jgi:phenylpropionate dioxygenase-like ring-hydroxylating dioxygenase large terminal subunit
MDQSLTDRMPYTTAYPELGTAPIDVEPITSSELFEIERERIFKRAWLKLGRVEELPEPGSYKIKQLDVVRTSIIIVRGKDGNIRAFHNICTHRGNKILQEAGNETTGCTRTHGITCRFHAWTFNTDGTLRQAARAEQFAELDPTRLGLIAVHCEVWEGFIFVNLDDEPRWSLAEYLGDMGGHFAGYPYHEATCTFRYSTVLNCNWKVSLYAFAEGYHVPTIHAGTLPSLAKLEHTAFRLFGPHSTSTLYVPPVPGAEPTPVTGRLGALLKGSAWHGARLDELPPEINPERRADFQFEFPVFFPNFVMHLCAGSGYPGMAYFHHQFWPIGVDRTLWEGTNYFRPPRNAAERIAIAHTNALHRNAWLEDTGTMEDTYAALASGVLKEMPLMDEEIMIRNTHKHWHEFMDTA